MDDELDDRGFKMGISNAPTNELKCIELERWIANFPLHSCRQKYTVDLDERFQICIANSINPNATIWILIPLQIKANELKQKRRRV